VATVPAPRTWTSSEQVTAAKLNTDIRDAFNFFKAPPMAVLRKSANQTIANNTTTAVIWDVEVLDRDGGHSNTTNNTRYTAQTTGWYHLRTIVYWSNAGSQAAWHDLYFRKNGSTAQNRSVWVNRGSLFDSPHSTEGYMRLVAGDYVEVMTILLNSPGSMAMQAYVGLPTYTSLHIRWVAA
jgi:hypothetical protein